jgi:hypothetical protein
MIEVTATVTTTSSTTVNPTATITAPAGVTDPNPGNNSYTLTFTAGIAEIEILVGAADPTATNPLVPVVSRPANGNADYLVPVRNLGPGAADGTIIKVPASSGLGINPSTPALPPAFDMMCSGGSTPAYAGRFIATQGFVIRTLPAGGFVNCVLSAKVTGAAGSNASITVVAEAPRGFHDPNPGNNTATDTLPIVSASTGSPTSTGSSTANAPPPPSEATSPVSSPTDVTYWGSVWSGYAWADVNWSGVPGAIGYAITHRKEDCQFGGCTTDWTVDTRVYNVGAQSTTWQSPRLGARNFFFVAAVFPNDRKSAPVEARFLGWR